MLGVVIVNFVFGSDLRVNFFAEDHLVFFLRALSMAARGDDENFIFLADFWVNLL